MDRKIEFKRPKVTAYCGNTGAVIDETHYKVCVDCTNRRNRERFWKKVDEFLSKLKTYARGKVKNSGGEIQISTFF